MIKFKMFFVLMMAISTFMVSCEEEEVTPDPVPAKANQFTYKNVNYALTKSYIHDGGQNSPGPISYSMDILLTSSTIIFDSTNGFSGTGDFVNLRLYTSDANGIPSGTYTFDAADNETAFTFGGGTFFTNYSIENETGNSYDVLAGSIDVLRTGANYEFTFNGSVLDSSSIVTISMYMKSTPMFLQDAKSSNKLFGR